MNRISLIDLQWAWVSFLRISEILEFEKFCAQTLKFILIIL